MFEWFLNYFTVNFYLTYHSSGLPFFVIHTFIGISISCFFSLQKNVSSEDAKAPPFIRALVTVVCEGAMERGNFFYQHSFLRTLFRYVSVFVTLHCIGAFFLTQAPYSLILYFVLCRLEFCWESTIFIITEMMCNCLCHAHVGLHVCW